MFQQLAEVSEIFPLGRGLYFFVICLVLALLEIQIEGKHGWAEKLPGWRWNSPWIRRFVGKPITGYHVYLGTMLLLFVHLPAVYTGWTMELQAELLAFFFFMTVCWDYLWFVWNPHFGVGRFQPQKIWWYPSWWLRLPTAYYSGLALSCALYVLPDFIDGPSSIFIRGRAWGLLFTLLLALTLGNVAASAFFRRSRSSAPDRV